MSCRRMLPHQSSGAIKPIASAVTHGRPTFSMHLRGRRGRRSPYVRWVLTIKREQNHRKAKTRG